MKSTNGSWMVATLAGLALALTACAPEQAADEPAETPMEEQAETPMQEQAEAAPAEPGVLNANEASAEQLAAIAGQAAADAIVAARPFESAAGLHAVVSEHVMEDGLDAVYGALWVPIDLNTASADEILLIPGVGDRMLHEFEEYRPYTSMEQFRREIGKYVDDEELERLVQYVEVR